MGKFSEEQNMNSLVIYKKMIYAKECKDGEAKTVALWDAVQTCPQSDDCPLHLDCPYLPSIIRSAEVCKCAIQEHYLNYVYTNLVENKMKELDQNQLDQIGFLLIPLYGHLIKFKMLEYVLNIQGGTATTTRAGTVSIHPIYREIRETMKLIVTMQWQLGLCTVRKPTNVFKQPTVEELMNGEHGMITDDLDDTTMKPPGYKYEKTNKAVDMNRKKASDARQRDASTRRRYKIDTP